MKIGIIGAGFIARAVATAATRAGHEVMVSNTRGLKSLHSLIGTIGCKGGTVEEATAFGDIALVAIPLYAYDTIPVEPLARKIVMDAGNYYPERDGAIPELDPHETTTSEILARHLPTSHVVKAFNAIVAEDIVKDGKPAGDSDRRGLPIAGDDADAKKAVAALLDEIGYTWSTRGRFRKGGGSKKTRRSTAYRCRRKPCARGLPKRSTAEACILQRPVRRLPSALASGPHPSHGHPDLGV